MGNVLSFVRNVISSTVNRPHDKLSNDAHVHEAMNWLVRAQRMTDNGGVSEGFHLFHGWLPSYPETTGYIVETFSQYANVTKDTSYIECAIKMADWLCSIQNNDGSIPDSYFKKKMVFDTGQVIFGFVEAFKVTGIDKYKQAAIRAADWIVSLQEKDGSWIKFAVDGIPHTYYSRVAWSLMKAYEVNGVDRYIEACNRNIEWCLRQQQENGWFEQSSFNVKNHQRPFTHTIAYTIRGILESGIAFNNTRYMDAAQKTLDQIAARIPESGFVGGTYDRNWNGDNRFSCLTGNAQLSISFLKLARLKNSRGYFNVGAAINEYLKSKQNVSTNNLNIRGAIAGSYPIWGEYIHFNYPNWAAKFFVDALLLEEEIISELR